ANRSGRETARGHLPQGATARAGRCLALRHYPRSRCWHPLRVNFLRLLALLLDAVPVAAAAADTRPRVGLVLSGGGARGAAHVGVLKVLEEMRVPIDAIAGTSMGAVVGGLYASGLSAAEIDATLRAVNWEELLGDRPPRDDLSFRRKEEDRNFLVRLPLGLHGGEFRLPKGLVQGQRLNELL